MDIPAIFTQFFSDIKPDKTISNIYNGVRQMHLLSEKHAFNYGLIILQVPA